MYLFSKPLICEDLLLLEDLLSEADLHLNDGLLINNTTFWSAIVQEKLLVVYLEGLTTLHIAHKTAEKVGVQIGLPDVLKGLILFSVCLFVFTVCVPNWSNPEDLDRPRGT